MASRDESALVRVGEAPDYLLPLAEGDRSLDTLQGHRILNRAGVVKSNTRKELRDKFPVGSIVVPAAETTLMQPGGVLTVVPVMFFDEWIVWNDRRDKDSPMIHARSLDPASDIARRADSFDHRTEEYAPPPKPGELPISRRYTHHLNFLCVVYGDHPLKGTLVAFSFSKGEYKKGLAWIGGIRMRRIGMKPAPLWCQVWELTIGERHNEKGDWLGIDARNPLTGSPWVLDQVEGQALKETSNELFEDHRKQKLSVGHEAAEAADSDSTTPADPASSEY